MSPNEPQIEIVGVERLIPYARNSRTHDDAQVAQIAASIREFGFTNPVLIDADHGIIAGHGRVLAARKLGLAEVPCIRLTHLTEIQKRAYVIADNKLALNAGWDEEALRLELGDLRAANVDLSLIGFTELEIGEINEETKDALSDQYTHKVDAPVYEPKGERPPVVELFDSTRADDLLSKVKASKAPEEVKRFLKTAASRHIVFDYGKIAEFYCHADKETQELMEDSALVIIDFKKAMQLGYVKLKAEIADALESEQGGEGAEDGADE
jgi:hypothetical protein